MGNWFSNLHIRKCDTLSASAITSYLCAAMEALHYSPAACKEEADGAFVILTDKSSQWYSVYSDLFSFEDPKQFSGYACTMSAELHTDILGISCFDSDFLYLNLIDASNRIDAWVGTGSAAGTGIRRRTNVSAWKSKLYDFESFQTAVRKKYTFAEDVLQEIEPCLCLPQKYSAASYEYLSELNPEEPEIRLYFKLPTGMEASEPPRLIQHCPSLFPCFLDQPSIVKALNVGGTSKGLSVYFIGPYVEHDEITFSNVCFVHVSASKPDTPITLQKVQLLDGQWAYYCHDPGFRIPPKVDDRLPPKKRFDSERERMICVRFVPHGDAKKILDIAVVLVPDKNPQGQTAWNAWYLYGSKEAFIRHHNETWKDYSHLLLKEEDYL